MALLDEEVVESSIELKELIDNFEPNQSLNEEEVLNICDLISRVIIVGNNGDYEFYKIFLIDNKTTDNASYLTTIYQCCAAFLDAVNAIDYSGDKPKSYYLGIALLNFLQKYKNNSPSKGVYWWRRKGDCQIELGEYNDALKTYFKGLKLIKSHFNWELGKLTTADKMVRDRSEVEIMLSKIVISSYNQKDYSVCLKYGNELLESIGVRGMTDLKSTNNPLGVKYMISKAQRRVKEKSHNSLTAKCPKCNTIYKMQQSKKLIKIICNNCKHVFSKEILTEKAESGIQKLSEFGGHSAQVKMYYYEKDELLSYESIGYLIFRNPSTKYGHWGVVIKGSEENVALLIKAENGCRFELYDQIKRTTIKTGIVTHIQFDFTTNENLYILNGHGLFKKKGVN